MPKKNDRPDLTAKLDVLKDAALPDALDELMWRGSTENPDATDVDAFISNTLIDAGAEHVRPIASTLGCDIVWLHNDIWWMRFSPAETTEAQARVLLNTEAALNRIQLALEAVNMAGWEPTLEYLEKATLTILSSVGLRAQSLCQELGSRNPEWIKLRDHEATSGTDWGAYTHLALFAEKERLPFRYEAHFDVNVSAGVAAVEATVPQVEAFMLVDGIYDPTDAAINYALDVALMTAGAAFGSSLALTNVVVTLFEGTLGGQPVLSVRFSRRNFIFSVLKKFKDVSPVITEDPEPKINIMGSDLRFDPQPGSFAPIEPYGQSDLVERHVEPARDERELTPELKKLLRADMARELDIFNTGFAAEVEEVEAIRQENQDSPFVALMHYQEMIERLEEALKAQGFFEQGRLPLYCSGTRDRLLLATYQTNATAAVELYGLPESLAKPDGSTRYAYLPDAYINAKRYMADCLVDLEEPDQALAILDECIAVAPSTPSIMIAKALLLGDLDRYEQAVPVLEHLLTMHLDIVELGLVFYRLAFAYWQLGKPELAAACYVLAIPGPTVSDQAQRELADLVAQEHVEALSTEDAIKLLNRNHITTIITDEALDNLAEIAIALTNSGIDHFAAAAVYGSSMYTGFKDLYVTIATSLRDGCPSAYLAEN